MRWAELILHACSCGCMHGQFLYQELHAFASRSGELFALKRWSSSKSGALQKITPRRPRYQQRRYSKKLGASAWRSGCASVGQGLPRATFRVARTRASQYGQFSSIENEHFQTESLKSQSHVVSRPQNARQMFKAPEPGPIFSD